MNFNKAKPCYKMSIYDSLEDALNAPKQNTNPRYKFFCQTQFTAGDIQQFEERRVKANGVFLSEIEDSTIDIPISVFTELYRNLTPLSVDNTFNYMFHKFKKGIYVSTMRKDDSLTFLPFSNKNFVNEWKHLIKVQPKYKGMLGFMKHVQSKTGYKFNPKSVNKFIDGWYANNCLVRYEFPIQECDTNVPILCDMFETLYAERKIPDMEFFVNKRDFPMLRMDGKEAYNHIFGPDQELLSHKYDTYAPILSMCTSENFADIPIPTFEDWARVRRKEGKYFRDNCKREYIIEPTPWDNRKSVAVFRGSSTGAGVTVKTNPRLKLAQMSWESPLDDDGMHLLDAGITEWNTRPRKLEGEKYLRVIEHEKFPFGLVDKLTPQEQTEYKYVINVEGHVAAFRLSLELEMGCVVLLVNSKYKLWYSHLLEPMVHYVPVKEDLSDLLEKIKWCKKNDRKCKKIAHNARKFAETYLSKEGILDYLQKLLFILKKHNGNYVYPEISIADIQLDRETSMLVSEYEKMSNCGDKIITEDNVLPNQGRTFAMCKAIQCILCTIDDTCVKDLGTLFSNDNSTVQKYGISNYVCLRKQKKDETRLSNKLLTHEQFIGQFVTNNMLKEIPNFAYIFGTPNGLYTEYIPGQTFYQYIHGNEFTLHDFLYILLQISLALHVALKRYSFVHHDLTPWNIMIQKLDHDMYVDYPINHKCVYRVKTRIVPVIIDYARAHAIVDNVHYGTMDLFKISTIQDILSLLLISVYEVCMHALDKETERVMIHLSNFISGTSYREKEFSGLQEIKYFFGKAKKYTELTCSKKGDLENKTPLDFIKRIISCGVLTEEDICKVNKVRYTSEGGDYEQVLKYFYSTNEKARQSSYASAIKNIIRKPFVNDPCEDLYYIQEAINRIDFMYDLIENKNVLEKVDSFLQKANKKFDKKHREIKEYFSEFHGGGPKLYPQSSLPNYDENVFLFPEKVLELLGEEVVNPDMPDCIESIILRDTIYNVHNDISELLVPYNTKIADRNTMVYIAKKMYRETLKVVSIKSYIKCCKEILRKIN